MYQRLGLAGVFGMLVVFAGLGVITWADWRVGVGITLVLFGLGVTVRALVSNLMRQFGMA
jgi:hypothetical protein